MHIRLLASTSIVVLVWCLGTVELTHANSFGVNLYGLSYHLNDKLVVAGQNDGRFNEFNKGIGARASFGTDSAATTLFVEGGSFKDTFEKQAKYLSVGFQVRLVHQLRVGLNAAVYTTKSINKGEPFFAPVPIVSYTVSIVTVNVVYLPKYEGFNPWQTIGGYLTIHLIKGDPKK